MPVHLLHLRPLAAVLCIPQNYLQWGLATACSTGCSPFRLSVLSCLSDVQREGQAQLPARLLATECWPGVSLHQLCLIGVQASSLLAESLSCSPLLSATMLPCGLQEEEQAQQPNADQGKGIEMEQDFEGSLEDMPQDDDGAGSEAEDGEEDRLQQVGTNDPREACHQYQIDMQVCAHERNGLQGADGPAKSPAACPRCNVLVVCGGCCF